MIPVRYQSGEGRVTRIFEDGIDVNHPLWNMPCPACDEPIRAGEPLALVYIGPGADPDDQQKFRDGRWHTGAAVAVHKGCAGA